MFKRFSENEGLTLKISTFKEIFYPIHDNSVPWENIENLVPIENDSSLRLDSWLALWK